jgi:GTP pyrophosphokinase
MAHAFTQPPAVTLDVENLLDFVSRELIPGLGGEEWAVRTHKAKRLLELCTEIELDDDALKAACLWVFGPYTLQQYEKIQKAFGKVVREIIEGAAQMENMSAFSKSSQGTVSDENLRKMLIAMVNDVRVVLIKLADQVDVLRNIKHESESYRRDAAQLTLDVYARLANRLGVWYLKWEMEDYALRYLESDSYHQVAQELAEKRSDREQYIDTFIHSITDKLIAADLNATVYGRPKHIYSIWRKMKLKGLSFNNILDIRAVRILVDSIDECYTSLGLVHTKWQYLPGEFDDYIATPKPNGYQSIHTAVIGPDEKVVEVQIRTREMHEENELGVAAHWRYKENTVKDQGIDNKIQWLRQLLEWKDDLNADSGLAAQFDAETEDARIYVFTPRGRVIDLPQGSTAIDFAYAIHTEVGHRTRGTRINQKMRPLNTALKTGDQVEIITVKTGSPSRDWIALPGFIKTNRARARITHWFKTVDRDQHLALGRNKLERELVRQRVHDISFEKIAIKNKFDNSDEMMIALGAGAVKVSKLLRTFIARDDLRGEKTATPRARKAAPAADRNQFIVHGVGKLKTQIANCCKPMPGEEIVGYITRGRGISIHQQSCSNILNLPEDDLNRLIDVSWGHTQDAEYVVSVSVLAYNRSNLLHDVTNVMKDSKVSIAKAVLDVQEDDSIVKIALDLEISGRDQLVQVLNQIKNIPNVLEAKRQVSS